MKQTKWNKKKQPKVRKEYQSVVTAINRIGESLQEEEKIKKVILLGGKSIRDSNFIPEFKNSVYFLTLHSSIISRYMQVVYVWAEYFCIYNWIERGENNGKGDDDDDDDDDRDDDGNKCEDDNNEILI